MATNRVGDWVWPLTGVLHSGVAAYGVAAEWGPLSLPCRSLVTR